MNALTYSLLSLYAQAAAPAAPAAPEAPAASTAELEAARAAAAANAAQQNAGESLNLLDLWAKLNDVEKGVMVILGVCAVYSIALLIEKVVVMRSNNTKIKDFLAAFRKANSVEEAEAIVRKMPASGIKTMFDAGMAEVRKTQDLGLYTMRDARDHTMQRVSAAMTVKQNEHLEDIGSSMTFLASIGSNAPFIGLFGTVWGIMTAFQAIAVSKNTSLAVVAPGIAEALLATAIGLFAAIPAVIAYNKLQADAAKATGRLETFADEFTAILQRQIDERMVPRDARELAA